MIRKRPIVFFFYPLTYLTSLFEYFFWKPFLLFLCSTLYLGYFNCSSVIQKLYFWTFISGELNLIITQKPIHSFVWNSPTLETTQISFSKWTVKQIAVHPYHRILLSNKKKEWSIDTSNNWDEFRGNYAE